VKSIAGQSQQSNTWRLGVCVAIALAALSSCGRGRSLDNSGALATGRAEAPEVQSSIRKVEIWRGKIFYGGRDPGSQPLDSMLQLLDLYSNDELSTVTEVSWASCRIARIEGVDRLPNLRRFSLGNCRISKISGLEYAPLLEELSLSQNDIMRIEGLDSLRNLRELHLDLNKIGRIEGLASLSNLQVLMLVGNEIEEVSGLSHLKSLKRLGLAGNRLRNITALGELTSLREVSIESPRNQLDEASLRFIEEWNAEHAGKPALQLHSGASTAVTQEEAQVSTEPEAPEPP
jgi:hypothetical protein